MFGREAFFTAGRMFAFLTEASLVLRLPEPERSDLLRAGLALTLGSEILRRVEEITAGRSKNSKPCSI